MANMQSRVFRSVKVSTQRNETLTTRRAQKKNTREPGLMIHHGVLQHHGVHC